MEINNFKISHISHNNLDKSKNNSHRISLAILFKNSEKIPLKKKEKIILKSHENIKFLKTVNTLSVLKPQKTNTLDFLNTKLNNKRFNTISIKDRNYSSNKNMFTTLSNFRRNRDLAESLVMNYMKEKERYFYKSTLKENDRDFHLAQVIRFPHVKKKLKVIPRNYSNMEDTLLYKQFIEKKVKSNFNLNFDSPYIRQLKCDFMINKFKSKKLKLAKKEDLTEYNNIKSELKEDNYEIELRDKFELNNDKLIFFKEIHDSLFKNFNYSKDSYKVKYNFVDKINYLYDTYQIPYIKNNLTKIIIEDNNKKNNNIIEWDHLNQIKYSIRKFLYQKLYKMKNINYKEKNKKNFDSFDINFKENKNKYNNNDDEPSTDIINEDNEVIYNCEQYFTINTPANHDISIANEKLKNILLKKGSKFI